MLVALFKAVFAALLLSVCLFIWGCSKKSNSHPIPASSPMAESIHFQYAVYLLPNSPIRSVDPSRILDELLAAKFKSLKRVNVRPTDIQQMVVRGYAPKSVIKDYAPPSFESLQYFGRGLSSEQAHALQHSDRAFILEFAHGRKDVWNGLRTANELIESSPVALRVSCGTKRPGKSTPLMPGVRGEMRAGQMKCPKSRPRPSYTRTTTTKTLERSL